MTDRRTLEQLSALLQLAPYQPSEWIHALALAARATGSAHAEMICWTWPNRTPFKLISDLSDSQSALIDRWEMTAGADPRLNPIVERGIRTPILQTVSDTEVISAEARKRHPVWTDFYDPAGIPHLCMTPLQRDGDTVLGLFLLRSSREGPVTDPARLLFARLAHAWRDAAATAQALGKETTQLVVGAIEHCSAAAILLDGTGRLAHRTSQADEIMRTEQIIRFRKGRPELPEGVTAHAECRLAGRTIELDRQFQPCLGCMIKAHHRPGSACKTACSISIRGVALTTLHLSLLPRERQPSCFGAALLIILRPEASNRLAADIAALLTPAERAVANELLSGTRPAEIASRRGVTIETVRSQVKRIYAKAGVPGAMEFIVRARIGRPNES